MKLNFIIDAETFSQLQLEAAVAIFAYYVFDWDRFLTDPYTPEELLKNIKTSKLDLKSQKEQYGYKAEKDTIQWWLDQSEDVKKQAIPHVDDLSLDGFLDEIENYLGEYEHIHKWWTRGTDFDSILIRRITESTGRRKIYDKIKYFDHRDTRSFIDGFTFFDARNDFIPMEDEEKWDKIFIKHRADHDIMADILRLQTITRIRNGL